MKQTLLLFFGLLFGLHAYAADGDVFTAKTIEGVEMTFEVLSEEDKTVQVGTLGLFGSSISRETNGSITVPSTVESPESKESYRVTAIGSYAFRKCSGLTSVKIPNCVTSIGTCAFHSCGSLTSINIPDGVTEMGDFAFFECSKLTTINIPDGVTRIEKYLFENCYSLTSINIPNGVTAIDESAFNGCSRLTSINIPDGVKSIAKEAFHYCRGLTSINIPSSVRSIGQLAFAGCSGLTSITVDVDNPNYDSRNNCNAIIDKKSNTLIAGSNNTITPDGVTSIGDCAFYGCSSLISINIPNSVTSIGNYAFYNCNKLTSINIPNGLASIGEHAFAYCSGLAIINIPDGVTSIKDWTFYDCSGLTAINIPNSVTSIGYVAFAGCSNLTSVNIPDGVTSIGKSAFERCSSLESVTIGNSLTGIDEWTFADCPSLVFVSIGNSVTSIASCAFLRCSNLTAITIPSSVTSIGNGAFKHCSKITDIYCYAENVPTTSANAFVDVPETATLHVLSTCVDEYKKTDPWMRFNNIIEIPNGEVEYSVDGVKYSLHFAQKQATVRQGYNMGLVVIPEKVIYNENEYTVTAIENSAFANSRSLKSVSLPKSITTIGEDAFKDCENLKLIVHGAEPPATESAIVVDSLEVPKGSTVTYARATSWNGTKQIYATEDGLEYYPVLVEVDSINCLVVNGEAAKDMEVEGGLPVNLSLDGGLENTSVLVMLGGIDITERLAQGDTCTFEPSAKYAENVLEVCAYPAKEVTLAKSGTLISQIGAANMNDVYSLKLVGDINGTDIRSILRLQNLRLLDLSEANIVEGGLAYYDNYTTTDNHIGRCFFKDMALLKRVIFPASAVYIQARAFEGCTSLRTVTIPEQMNEIDIAAFNDCARLTYLRIEDGDEPLKIYCEDFDYDDYKWRNLHNSPLVAFYMGRNIAYIDSYDTNTRPFTMYKETLRTVTIGKRVTEITSSFFYGCTGLKSVTIGSHVKAIGSYAFSVCPSLKDIYSFSAVPPEIQATTFDAETEQQATLHVPVGSTDLYWLYPYWENFFDIKENPAAQIAEVRSDTPKVVKGIYTLDGRKCNTTDTSTLPRGIYIVDGMKLLVK